MFDVDYDFGMYSISVEQSVTTHSEVLTAIKLETIGFTVSFIQQPSGLFVCLFSREQGLSV